MVIFLLCFMDSCFDYFCCDDMEEIWMYYYGEEYFLLWYFKDVLMRSLYYIIDLEKVCLFFVIVDRRVENFFVLSFLFYWNNGFNYVVIFIVDKLRNFSVELIEMVVIMIFSMYQSVYCIGFDFNVFFLQKKFYIELQGLKVFDRKYLLMFKGMYYLYSFLILREMYNGEDVIVVIICKQVFYFNFFRFLQNF